MAVTRAFKSGNSQAVRIPKDLQFERMDLELEIRREGDALVIRPLRPRLTDVLERFGAFSADLFPEGREQEDQQERDAL